MIGWTLKWVLISFVLIFLIHHLYNFFKNVLTVPKVKDLVNKPTKEYETIMQTINNGQQKTVSMNNELSNFLNNLKSNNNDNNVIDIANNNINTFSSYDASNSSNFENPFAAY
jgi:hypothetical protein